MLGGSADLVWDNTNSRLGVGITNPSDALNIGTGKKFRTTHSASVYQQIFSSASGNLINAFGDSLSLTADVGAISLTTTASQPIIFETNNATKLTITGSSNYIYTASGVNVGIGTSSPDTTTLLTVAGAVTITGANSGHGASRLKLGQDTSAISQIRFYGVDASTAGILQFTGSSSDGTVGSERMRIDSSGSLLVGTTTAPTAGGLSRSVVSFKQLNDSGTYANIIYSSGIQLEANGNTNVLSIGYDGSSFGFNASYRTTGGYVPIAFWTGGYERVRIDINGNLLVNSTSALAKFVVDGTAYITSLGLATTRTTGKLSIDSNINSENGIDIKSLQSPAGGSYIIFRNSAGDVAGSITHSSSTAVLYNVTSSGNIDAIKVRSFNWIADGSHQKYGMIAQELIEVVPYAVNKPENPNDMMGVDYSKLVPMMIKEIQDLKQRITTLENK